MAVILSLDPHPDMPPAVGDKFVHFAGYMLMAAAVLAFARSYRELVTGAAITVAGGLAIEALQALVPNRFPELSDAIANTAGAATGLAIAMMLLALARLALSRRP